MNTNQEDFKKLKEMITNIDFCMLTTVDESGDLHSRPMSLNSEIDSEGNLWFFTSSDSMKAHEIERTPKVNVSFANPDDHHYVSLSGTAQLETSKEKIRQLWKPILKAWFPEGLDQPDLALLKVRVEKAEYWDSPSGKIAQVLNFMSAVVTGKQIDMGENKKLDMSR